MNTSSGNIILVGMMGAGKTTIGRLLATRLNKTFVDADHEIEARTGVRIPLIFEIEGEQGFRRRETMTLGDIARGRNLVLATGGGAVTTPETREILKSSGVTVYLSASLHDLWMRTRNDRNRPMLHVADPRARLAELLRLRDPLYREVADLVIETGRPGPHKLVPEIIATLAHDARFASVIENSSELACPEAPTPVETDHSPETRCQIPESK